MNNPSQTKTRFTLRSVTHADTGEPRTEGRYPQRIGSTYRVLFLNHGNSAWLDYVLDSQGNPKEGIYVTSVVREWYFEDDVLTIITLNSVYRLQQDKEVVCNENP